MTDFSPFETPRDDCSRARCLETFRLLRPVRVEQPFLEPACGDADLLLQVLRHKLGQDPVTAPYFATRVDARAEAFPEGAGVPSGPLHTAVRAASTVYGLDAFPSAVARARTRLYAFVVYGVDLLCGMTGRAGADRSTQELPDLDDEAGLHRLALAHGRARAVSERFLSANRMLLSTLKLIVTSNVQQGDFSSTMGPLGQPLALHRWTFSAGEVRSDTLPLSALDEAVVRDPGA